MRNCLTVLTAVSRCAGPVTQPIFQPVSEKVLPEDEIVRVRPPIPGSAAIGRCVAPS